jgi:peroxiredoxin
MAATSAQAKLPIVGQVAPDFKLTLVSGETVTLADLKGQVIVLNYWATWCAPCIKELPLLDSYYILQKSRGLAVFAITTENSVPLYHLKKLFAAMAIPSVRRIRGPDGIDGAVPTNIVIGRDGRVRYAKAGSFDLDGLNALLVPLLRENAGGGTIAASP